MFVIKDPDWYLHNQNTKDKIYSNIIFVLLAIYYYKKQYKELSFLFLLLAIGSTIFHVKTNKYTLFFDRITMLLIFSYFFNIFYNKISFVTYSIIGIITVIYWLYTENLLFYFLFQLFGLILFLVYFKMNLMVKLGVVISYVLITYSQIIEKGKYHSLKHIFLGLLSLLIV